MNRLTTISAMPSAPTDDHLAEIEQALAVIVRHATLPRQWVQVLEAASAQLPHNVDRSGYGLLGRIARLGPIRPSELAHQTGVRVSTISRQVAELERQGLVTRKEDSSDRRASTFTLSEQGELVLAALRQARHELIERRLADWPTDERAQLAHWLSKLAATFAAELDETIGCKETQ